MIGILIFLIMVIIVCAIWFSFMIIPILICVLLIGLIALVFSNVKKNNQITENLRMDNYYKHRGNVDLNAAINDAAKEYENRH